MTTEKYHKILAFLRNLIEGTPWEGFVYTVGGCCRDSVLGLPIKDVDLAVNKPDGGIAFAEWLHKKRLTAGRPIMFCKYGTARLHLRKFPDDELEIVQTRSEKYTDRTSRDPSTAFGTIEQDCFRRDLTINSLYYDISRDRILDITGKGISDIENHIIRTPSDPDVTFDDDPVRIIRAIRFSARYGWEIDAPVFDSIRRYADRLAIITPERMQSEFEKVLTGPRPSYALELLRKAGAIKYIMPELEQLYGMKQSAYHFGTAWEHTLAVVDKVPDSPLLRLSALLHDIGKTVAHTVGENGDIRFPGHDRRCAAIIDRVMRRLKYKPAFIDRVIFLCVHHEMAKSWGANAEKMTDAALRRMQFVCYSSQRMNLLLDLIDADNRSYAPDHCMPEQVPGIRRRSDALVKSGDALFEYVMPLKPSKIRRLLRVAPTATAILDRARSEILSAVYAKPRMKAEEMAEFVGTLAEKIPDEQHVATSRKRRRGRRKEK